ncbi:hypothetical protein CI105_07515 [Candidatus Izimaplasma bacterium ZiA1]|uniref:hypothetical protein n=1 Tax=Candidatus Izimoplasma sp. ZiA1 TaxID=2024899 RepID=UPI000BAA4991|nr:hypothetical protein CI105_07515 [Candidatus Izimaplasma bacterium ZiA1]
MKKICLGLMLVILLNLYGCAKSTTADDNFTYVEYGITVDSDMTYYRSYTDTNCDTFDISLFYAVTENFYYIDPVLSNSDSCSSDLYVMDGSEYKLLSLAFSHDNYTEDHLRDAAWTFDIYKTRNISPTIATLEIVLKDMVYLDAYHINEASKMYCISQATCNVDEAITYTDLSQYIHEDFRTEIYDLTANAGVICVKNENAYCDIQLERIGTGDYEFPFSVDFTDKTYADMVVDNN